MLVSFTGDVADCCLEVDLLCWDIRGSWKYNLVAEHFHEISWRVCEMLQVGESVWLQKSRFTRRLYELCCLPARIHRST